MTAIDWENTLQMRERCADCAFCPGTEARRSPLQPEKAQLCVDTGIAFFCHEHPDTYGSSKVVCRGFMDAFTAKTNNGYYDRLPEWKRDVLMLALDAIESAENGETPDLIAMVHAHIKATSDSARDSSAGDQNPSTPVEPPANAAKSPLASRTEQEQGEEESKRSKTEDSACNPASGLPTNGLGENARENADPSGSRSGCGSAPRTKGESQ